MARNRQARRSNPQHPKGAPNAVMSPKVAARPRASQPAPIVLDRITDLRIDQALRDEELYREVAAARLARFTWREIGEALGTTAQSAHKRFGPSRVGQ